MFERSAAGGLASFVLVYKILNMLLITMVFLGEVLYTYERKLFCNKYTMKETEKKKILIIEDEKPLAHALSLKLSHEGFEVVTTASGEEGLQLLTKDTFSLVLTDLIIPGVDGFKVLETIQDKKIKVPVIVITNLNQEEDKKRVFDLGAASFFVKSNSPISEIVENVKSKIASS